MLFLSNWMIFLSIQRLLNCINIPCFWDAYWQQQDVFFLSILRRLTFNIISLHHEYLAQYKTRFEYEVRIYCKSQTKLKVVKWGWNEWNGHILVYIYHKQYGIMQKKSMKKLKRPTSVILQWNVGSSVLKTPKKHQNWRN